MKADGWIDFKPDQAFAPAQCDAFTLVNGVPKVDFWQKWMSDIMEL